MRERLRVFRPDFYRQPALMTVPELLHCLPGMNHPGYRRVNKRRFPRCIRNRRESNANGRGYPIQID